MLIVAALAGCHGGSASPDAGAGGSGGTPSTAMGGAGGRGTGTGGVGGKDSAGTGGTPTTAGAGGGPGGRAGAGSGGSPGLGGAAAAGSGGSSNQGGNHGGAGGSGGTVGSAAGGRAGSAAAGSPGGSAGGAGGTTPRDAGADDSGDAKPLPPINDAGPANAASCMGLAQLKLGTPMWTINENNVFVERAPKVGVRSRLVIPLSNPTSSITTTAPAILLTSTTPGVSGTGRYELFGIGANQTASLIWLVNFDAPLVSGSTVHFQADVYGWDMGRFLCADSPTMTFDVTLN